ncbi:hypothetical protein, partial [Herbiconiux daphne]
VNCVHLALLIIMMLITTMSTDKELEAIARGLKASREAFEREQILARAKLVDKSNKPRRVPQPPLPPKKSPRDRDILFAFRNK